MKKQWTILAAIIFAVIIAIFAVINAHPVRINYLFGTADWPLVLVILGSFLIGVLLIFSVGLMRFYKMQRQVKSLKKENQHFQELLQNEDHRMQNKKNEKTGKRGSAKEDPSTEPETTAQKNQSSSSKHESDHK